jgi:hypothetical protein
MFRSEVQSGLPAEIGQNGVRPLFFNDLFQAFHRERFHIGNVRHLGVGHDGGRVGIHQEYLVAQPAKRFPCLGSGVAEFTGLTNDNETRTNDHDFVDSASPWHVMSSFFCRV